MFGGNVTSSWANPQGNQQQTPANPFGQTTSAFGATNTNNAFGSTSAFGQPQQQQQQGTGSIFGTPAPATGTTSAFGGFGNTANTSTSAFGAKPATTGFGAFGGGTTTGTSAFGSGTSAFGQPAAPATTTTSLFGQPAAQTAPSTSAFGGGGLFGQAKPATGFGASACSASSAIAAIGTDPTPATGAGTHPVVTTGTQNPPYAAHHEKDGTTTSQYQAITCMPAYAGYSFEELRVQDYAQGRKTAGAFGQSATFGTTPTTTQPTTSLFGATQPAQTTSVFGATPAAPATTGFGAFGSNTNTTTTQPATTGLFGGGTTNAFGTTPAQPATTSAFGGFGAQQQQQPQQSTSLFGGGTGAFGSTAPKPAFGGFGSTPAATTGTTNAFGGGAFGTQNTQQPATQTTGLFGATQPAATTNAFGTTGSAFGATANKPLFGATPATTAPATTTFGGFGATQQPAQQNQATGTGLFGTGGGLFGQQQNQQQQQQQQPAAGTGLFGSTTTTQPAGTGLFGGGGGIFGNTQANQQPNQQQTTGTGLFGAKPAAPAAGTGLFGGGFGQQQNATNTTNTGTTGGLFGNTLPQPAQQNNAFGGGLFGNKPAAPAIGGSTSTGQTGGLFGSTLGATNNLLGSTAPAQGSLTASIAQPIGSNLPIFSMLPPGPRLVDLDQSQPKKKPPFFVDVPTRSPIPRIPQSFAPASSTKLRGFGASVAQTSATGNPFAGSVSFLQGKPNALLTDSRAGSVGPESILGRSGSPALGSGSRQSVKKVILDKKVEPSQLFIKSSSPGPGGKYVFSPALSIAARESENAAAAAAAKGAGGAGGASGKGQQQLDSPTPAPRAQSTQKKFTAQSTKSSAQSGSSDPSALEEGDYWVKPSVEELKAFGHEFLASFQGLVVGRVGYGQIEFLEPVDLTGLSKLNMLLGQVIHFEDKECAVYPDSEDSDKPPPGSGLNVKARLTLERCWAVDKATREPIKDPNHPAAVKHLKRLKNMKDTHFESFDIETGKWTFCVDSF